MVGNKNNDFHGQSVFISGVTGFLGTALAVKILKNVTCRRLTLLVRG